MTESTRGLFPLEIYRKWHRCHRLALTVLFPSSAVAKMSNGLEFEFVVIRDPNANLYRLLSIARPSPGEGVLVHKNVLNVSDIDSESHTKADLRDLRTMDPKAASEIFGRFTAP